MTTNQISIGVYFLEAIRCAKRSWIVYSVAVAMAKGVCFGLPAACFSPHPAAAADDAVQLSNQNRPLPAHKGTAPASTGKTQLAVTNQPKRANFKQEHPSLEARLVADWVVDSGDNRKMSFVIIDKTNARVFVFDADGLLRGAAPALLGLARGDDTVPGIGDRKLSSIRPEERTTPSGRFVAALGRNMHGVDILWVDYDAAISLHRVVTSNRKEHRLQRLATTTLIDKRISYGCINVPAKFFDKVVRPAFTRTNGIVYVLPETRSAIKAFGAYDVDEHARLLNAGQPEVFRNSSGARTK